MGTYMAKKESVNKSWFLVDLKGKTLGRAATKIADILRGKHKSTYTPHVDNGDYVVVINAALVKLSGNKMTDKMYHSHSGYIGGIKSVPADKMLEKHPETLIIKAVKGMLPKNYLSKKILKQMKVYAGSEHPHQAGKPEEVKI